MWLAADARQNRVLLVITVRNIAPVCDILVLELLYLRLIHCAVGLLLTLVGILHLLTAACLKSILRQESQCWARLAHAVESLSTDLIGRLLHFIFKAVPLHACSYHVLALAVTVHLIHLSVSLAIVGSEILLNVLGLYTSGYRRSHPLNLKLFSLSVISLDVVFVIEVEARELKGHNFSFTTPSTLKQLLFLHFCTKLGLSQPFFLLKWISSIVSWHRYLASSPCYRDCFIWWLPTH